MSYALGLAGPRPAPAGILAFSGFIPVVAGWEPSLADRTGLRVLIAHGREDPVMNVDMARRARDLLSAGGLDVEYHESDVGHQIDGAALVVAVAWLALRSTTTAACPRARAPACRKAPSSGTCRPAIRRRGAGGRRGSRGAERLWVAWRCAAPPRRRGP